MTSTDPASVGWAEEGQVSWRSQGSGSVKASLEEHFDPVILSLGVYLISLVHRGMCSDVPLKLYFYQKKQCPPITEA